MATYNVSPETNKIIKEYAESIGVQAEEALNRLLITADSRRRALKKYAKSPKAKAVKAKAAPKAKKVKAPKGTSLAKKTAAPKAKKAKAPKAASIPTVSGETL